MKLGVRFLSRQTGYSEKTTNKAINELIAKGYFSATQSNKRTGRVFTLLVSCPAECKQKDKHYSKAEKQALIAIENTSQEIAECGTFEPLSVELENAECGTSYHTNKELNKEIKNLNSQTKTTEKQTNKTTEKTEVAEVVSVGLDDWVNLCLDTLLRIPADQLSKEHRELETDPVAYHLSANSFLADRRERGSVINDPAAYLARVITKAPHELMNTNADSPKTAKRLSKYLLTQLNADFSFRDKFDNNPLHNFKALTADLMATYGDLWLNTFADTNSISTQELYKAVNGLLANNPAKYEPLESATPANPY